MAVIERFVAGRRTDSPGDIAALAMAIASEAKKHGFTVGTIRSSRSPRRSASKYLPLTDVRKQLWLLRISDHDRPRRNRQPEPHFDLISLDGKSGLKCARRWIARMIAGEYPYQPLAKWRRKPRKV